jgi:hypothetical protein
MAQKTYSNHHVREKSHNGTIVAILNNCIMARLLSESETAYERKMYKVESAHPVIGEGARFIECPHYGDCLMHAAKQNWRAWTCEKCPNLRLGALCKRLKFISPYYELLSEIYPEFRRKYEPAMSLLDSVH